MGFTAQDESVTLWGGPFDGRTVSTGGGVYVAFREPLPATLVAYPLPAEHRYRSSDGHYLGVYRPGTWEPVTR